MPDPADVIGHCPNCQTAVRRDHPYAWCSKCGKPLPAEMDVGTHPHELPVKVVPSGPRVQSKHFRAAIRTLDALFEDVSDFATSVGRERLISINVIEGGIEGGIMVWYWTE